MSGWVPLKKDVVLAERKAETSKMRLKLSGLEVRLNSDFKAEIALDKNLCAEWGRINGLWNARWERIRSRLYLKEDDVRSKDVVLPAVVELVKDCPSWAGVVDDVLREMRGADHELSRLGLELSVIDRRREALPKPYKDLVAEIEHLRRDITSMESYTEDLKDNACFRYYAKSRKEDSESRQAEAERKQKQEEAKEKIRNYVRESVKDGQD